MSLDQNKLFLEGLNFAAAVSGGGGGEEALRAGLLSEPCGGGWVREGLALSWPWSELGCSALLFKGILWESPSVQKKGTY